MASITWHVSTLAAAVLCGLLILAPITDASADIRIGSISNIDSSDTVINGVTLDAPIMAASRAKLLDPEHFRGEGDAFPPRVVTITDVVKDASTGTVLTPEVLADLDVFFVGQFSQEVLTLGERDLGELAAAVLCGLLILAPITDASADIRIGSISNIDSSDTVINGVTLDAPIMAASRAKLLDPEHFRGEGDAFPPRVVTITDVVKDASTGTVLTPEVLAEAS